MVRQVGILWRKECERMQKFFILDRKLGKISVLSSRSDISRGSLMMYTVSSNRTSCNLNNVDVLDLPLIQSVSDLTFFHQVLELCYYFIPFGKGTTDIFELLLFLYASFESLNTRLCKKLFLCKFFAHLGFYPHEEQPHIQTFRLVRSQYIDALIKKPIDLSLERKLDQWLDYCISMHPCSGSFKTVSFFMSRKS